MKSDHDGSHFHSGEVAIHERLGFAKEIEQNTKGLIYSAMPFLHRDLFVNLPFVILAVVDDQGKPWAMPVFGRPGFISSPDDQTLVIHCFPELRKILKLDLSVGQKIGLIGVELPTRRRNRMNGRVHSIDQNGFSIQVEQSFGNCPQYIQKRQLQWQSFVVNVTQDSVQKLSCFSSQSKALIERADTFFIASRTPTFTGDPRTGLDASHRGGRPGFVKVEESRITFPDFQGNRYFNTLGNIQEDGRAGLFFPDFESGEAVFVSGRAQIIWDEAQVSAFDGAERLVVVDVENMVYVEQFVAVKGTLTEAWPYLNFTGSWADNVVEKESAPDKYHHFIISKKVLESHNVYSFYLMPKNENLLVDYKSGQFLPVRVKNSKGEWVYRNYTLSQAWNNHDYRISVKKEALGVASTLLHDQYQIGDNIDVALPTGRFVLQHSHRVKVMLSAGIGITPMIAMLSELANNAESGIAVSPLWFIHGTQNSETHSFREYIQQLSEKYDWLHVHTAYSRPTTQDFALNFHQSEGHISVDLLQALLPLGNCDFYLCGPEGFMKDIYRSLINVGVETSHIFYEFFGENTWFDEQASFEQRANTPSSIEVHFASSALTALWSTGQSLLALAEKQGLSPSFGCRSGSCGLCATKVIEGEFHYPNHRPTYEIKADDVLICCAKPTDNNERIVIDL